MRAKSREVGVVMLYSDGLDGIYMQNLFIMKRLFGSLESCSHKTMVLKKVNRSESGTATAFDSIMHSS